MQNSAVSRQVAKLHATLASHISSTQKTIYTAAIFQ